MPLPSCHDRHFSFALASFYFSPRYAIRFSPSASKIALHDTLHVCTVVPNIFVSRHSRLAPSTRRDDRRHPRAHISEAEIDRWNEPRRFDRRISYGLWQELYEIKDRRWTLVIRATSAIQVSYNPLCRIRGKERRIQSCPISKRISSIRVFCTAGIRRFSSSRPIASIPEESLVAS